MLMTACFATTGNNIFVGAGNVMQYTQLASVLIQHEQYAEAEGLLTQLLLHVETVKVLLHSVHAKALGLQCTA